jgi:hypothetical protein
MRDPHNHYQEPLVFLFIFYFQMGTLSFDHGEIRCAALFFLNVLFLWRGAGAVWHEERK